MNIRKVLLTLAFIVGGYLVSVPMFGHTLPQANGHLDNDGHPSSAAVEAYDWWYLPSQWSAIIEYKLHGVANDRGDIQPSRLYTVTDAAFYLCRFIAWNWRAFLEILVGGVTLAVIVGTPAAAFYLLRADAQAQTISRSGPTKTGRPSGFGGWLIALALLVVVFWPIQTGIDLLDGARAFEQAQSAPLIAIALGILAAGLLFF